MYELGATDYVTKPWELGELSDAVLRSLRDNNEPLGVLLISDDPAALAPLQLALQTRVRVAAMSVADGLTTDFPARAIVLHTTESTTTKGLSAVAARFPGADVVWVSDAQKHGAEHLIPQNRIDLTLNRLSSRLGDRLIRRPLSHVMLSAIELMVARRPLHWLAKRKFRLAPSKRALPRSLYAQNMK